jgi:hypothetical protein
MTQGLTLTLDMNVLNHLGIGLYSSAPAVLTELVANAWDAEATEVHIDLDAGNRQIIMRDNGHGMNLQSVQSKFLTVGYARREKEGTDKSPTLNRPVMGRKGIGKLSMFSLANRIDVFTFDGIDPPVDASIDVSALQDAIKKGQPYYLGKGDESFRPIAERGTSLVLRDITRDVGSTPRYLIERIARRFSVLGAHHNFSVLVNGDAITPLDRGFYKDVQFIWYFDTKTDAEISPLLSTLASIDSKVCKGALPASLDVTDPRLVIRGYIATVDKPKKLKALDANLNQLAVFARGRVFQEDLLSEIGNSKIFNNYIVGEIHADFLDNDDVDRATASRESIKHDDPKYVMLRSAVARCLTEIEHQWDDWRRALGYAKSEEPNPVVQEWLDQIANKLERKLAEKLVTSISNTKLGNDEETERQQKAMLYKSAIVGFEKLRARAQLEKLENVTSVLSPEFAAIFSSLSDLEETYYHDITRSRLEVIQKFQTIVDDEELEKVAQRFLFNNLWLLDPTWGRVTGSEETERVLTEELRKIDPDADEGARLDITFRTGSGKCVIVELKRPGKRVGFDALLAQGRKYRQAILQWIKEHPDAFGFRGAVPPVDLFFLISESPVNSIDDEKSMAAYNGQILTYRGLIANARKAYEEYLAVHTVTNRIDKLVSRL